MRHWTSTQIADQTDASEEHMSASTTDLKPIYLILSEQEFLLQQAVDRLRSRVGEVADLDFNVETFDAESATGSAVTAACNTLPFASDHRLVIVRNIEKLSKDAAESLAVYAADPAPTCVLALSGTKLAKNTRLYKAVDRLGGVVERKTPRGAEFIKGVISLAADRGKQMTPDVAEAFVAATGEDLRKVSAELDKLVSFVGDTAQISRGDVESVVANTAKTKIWEFTESLADRDCRRSLVLASSLVGDGESVFGLHAMAVRMIRDLIAARSLLDRGSASTAELSRMLGRPDWQLKRLTRQARAFDSSELVDLLRSAAAGEAEMKTSRDARLVLERWIVKICGV
jgi:DNA polymerase-3 subunit delta